MAGKLEKWRNGKMAQVMTERRANVGGPGDRKSRGWEGARSGRHFHVMLKFFYFEKNGKLWLSYKHRMPYRWYAAIKGVQI